MMKEYDMYYNDRTFYGTIAFKSDTEVEIEKLVNEEIEDNNKNPNPLYHISRDNFIEI